MLKPLGRALLRDVSGNLAGRDLRTIKLEGTITHEQAAPKKNIAGTLSASYDDLNQRGTS